MSLEQIQKSSPGPARDKRDRWQISALNLTGQSLYLPGGNFSVPRQQLALGREGDTRSALDACMRSATQNPTCIFPSANYEPSCSASQKNLHTNVS